MDAKYDRGYVDLDHGVIYRKAVGERVAHNKRKPPAKIPPRLLRFLRYWKDQDEAWSAEQEKKISLRYVVHFQGRKLPSLIRRSGQSGRRRA